MSLTIYLHKTKKEDSEVLFRQNLTHNLTYMAEAAGLYEAMWRPYRLHPNYDKERDKEDDYDLQFEREVNIRADLLLPYLIKGYAKLVGNKEEFEKFNPANGWGTYGGLVRAVSAYIDAITEYPIGYVFVSR